MLSSKGAVYRLGSKLRGMGITLLWMSQRRLLGSIGKGSHVSGLPRITGYENIHIGRGLRCGESVRIEAWERYGSQTFEPRIVIGDNVTLTDRCYISCADSVSIGNGCLFGRDVFVTDNLHGDTHGENLDTMPVKRPLTLKGAVTIGSNVWIGRQVTILPGVTIGSNSIVGANSVVSRDVPPNCVVAGVPTRVIREFDQS